MPIKLKSPIPRNPHVVWLVLKEPQVYILVQYVFLRFIQTSRIWLQLNSAKMSIFYKKNGRLLQKCRDGIFLIIRKAHNRDKHKYENNLYK